MTAVPMQIAKWVPGDYRVLGADGFGFADTRPAARRFFNVDAESVVVQMLQALADAGEVTAAREGRRVPHRRPSAVYASSQRAAATPSRGVGSSERPATAWRGRGGRVEGPPGARACW